HRPLRLARRPLEDKIAVYGARVLPRSRAVFRAHRTPRVEASEYCQTLPARASQKRLERIVSVSYHKFFRQGFRSPCDFLPAFPRVAGNLARSEERRVGKEG